MKRQSKQVLEELKGVLIGKQEEWKIREAQAVARNVVNEEDVKEKINKEFSSIQSMKSCPEISKTKERSNKPQSDKMFSDSSNEEISEGEDNVDNPPSKLYIGKNDEKNLARNGNSDPCYDKV